MSKDNDLFNSPGSPDGSTRSPEIVSDEIIHTTNDENDNIAMVRIENITGATIPTSDDEEEEEDDIVMGDCEPSEVVNGPASVAADDQLVDIYPLELNALRGESPDEIFRINSPINLAVNDYELPLSPAIQNVPNYDLTLHDHILVNGEQTAVQPVQYQDDDLQMIHAESTGVQPGDNQAVHEPMNIVILAEPPIDVIDLTQDADEEGPTVIDLTQDETGDIQEPEVIDLTPDDDVNEEVSSVQPTPNTDHVDDNEQINHSDNDIPAVDVLPLIETLPLVAGSSSEVNDQNINFATETDNFHQTLENTAQLQQPILLLRTKKRSFSSDEPKRHNANRIKRSRNSVA